MQLLDIILKMSDSQSDREKYLNMKLDIHYNCQKEIKKYLVKYNPFRRISIMIWQRNSQEETCTIDYFCNSQINPYLYSFQAQIRTKINAFDKVITFLSYQCRFITTIKFYITNISDNSLSYFVSAKWLFLMHIDLSNNKITASGVKQLGKGKWKYLKQIDLSDNPIKNTGIKQLVKHPWNNLRKISLNGIQMTKDGVLTLLRGKWPKLKRLSLIINNLDCQIFQYFLFSNWSRKIKIDYNDILYLYNNGEHFYMRVLEMRQLQKQKYLSRFQPLSAQLVKRQVKIEEN